MATLKVGLFCQIEYNHPLSALLTHRSINIAGIHLTGKRKNIIHPVKLGSWGSLVATLKPNDR